MAASSLHFRELGMVNGADENLEMLLGGNGEDRKPESLLKVMKKNDEAEILNLEEGLLAGDDDASTSLNGSASPSLQPVTPPTADTSTAAANRKTVSSLQKPSSASSAIKPGKTRPSPASNPNLNPSSANTRAIVRSHSSRAAIAAPRRTQTPSTNSTVPSAVRKPAVTSNRPASTSRGRPNSTKVNPRQQSCSPARLRNDYQKPGNMVVMQRSKGRNTGNGDEVNPVLIGTKMVERVVNMRKLAPPKEEERPSLDHDKKTCKNSSGFGRSFSKKSLEMAIRHMDIGRSIPDDFARNSGSSHSSKSLSKPRCAQVHNQQK